MVECYKEAICSYLEGTFTEEKKQAWDERLKTVFNRGFWNGYYLGQRLGEWSKNYGSEATERKVYVGKGIKYFSNIGVGAFLVVALLRILFGIALPPLLFSFYILVFVLAMFVPENFLAVAFDCRKSSSGMRLW